MINSFVPLLNAVVVIAFIITGIRILWQRIGWKDGVPTFVYGSLLAAFANKPSLLSSLGTAIIALIQSLAGNIKF
jgi:hypothetical protein